MNEIKEIKDFYLIKEKITDVLYYDKKNTSKIVDLLEEINSLIDEYRSNYVKKES